MGGNSGSIKFLLLIAAVVFIVYFVMTKQRSNYIHDHPILQQVSRNFSQLDPKYASIPLQEGGSAYTENKETITLCLRDPETHDYYDMNTLMYVSLHELAHVISKTHGHNAEFKKNFSDLLREAARKKIYDPRKNIPTTYCGVGPND